MNPSELLQLSGGYWSICALHAAVKLDIFTCLSDGDLTAEEISRRTGSDLRGMTMLLDALSSLELLAKTSDRYCAPPSSLQFLSRNSESYLGYIILHHHQLMAGWTHLDEAVIKGAPIGTRASHNDDESARENFLMGMFNLASLLAPKVVPCIDLSGRGRLLDLGGGPGTYAIHFCRHNPELRAVIYDLPTTRRFAEKTVESFLLSDRISFSAGDILSDNIGSGFDVIWISHLLHSEGPQNAELILKKAVQALVPGGLVLVQEFILDNTRDSPPFPALFSLNMLIGTNSGQSYSNTELAGMMTRAGIVDIRRVPLELPNGAGIMAGSIPER
jgi:SAM-dependent methyltransferase